MTDVGKLVFGCLGVYQTESAMVVTKTGPTSMTLPEILAAIQHSIGDTRQILRYHPCVPYEKPCLKLENR